MHKRLPPGDALLLSSIAVFAPDLMQNQVCVFVYEHINAFLGYRISERKGGRVRVTVKY